MIIFNSVNSNKTDVLIEKYFELIKNGANSDNILFLVQNGHKKNLVLEKIKKKSKVGVLNLPDIHSFYGLARVNIENYWPIIENKINDTKARHIAHLCGLEVSQNIFKQCISQIEFKGYNSKVNILHQLFRRYSLIVQNALDKKDIEAREKILKESYCDDVNKAISLYKANTLNLRAFDYLRQLSIFEYVYKNTTCPYEYVIIDDADEITSACFEYLKHIKKDIKEFIIAQDPLGSSRLGYLSATHIDFEKFLNEKGVNQKEENAKNKRAQELYDNIKNNKASDFSDITIKAHSKRDEMILDATKKIKELLDNNVNANKIAIATPVCDEFLQFCLKKLEIDIFYLSGSEKLSQNKDVSTLIEILKMANRPNTDVSPLILKAILNKILKMDENEVFSIISDYQNQSSEYKTPTMEFLKSKNNEKINIFLNWLEENRLEPLSTQLYKISEKYIEQKIDNKNSIFKINQIFKQIKDFEDVYGDKFDKFALIEQLENTIISENPISSEIIDNNSIIVASAQKIIDYEICPDYLFLLDCSNENWIKQDIGMLYNSWVFQKNWNKTSFEHKDNLELTLDRTARILYKLYQLKNREMLVHSSLFDSSGLENISGIEKFFTKSAEVKSQNTYKITPRADQEAVLNYKSGKMALSATAGSGKTTILLLLVIKLLNGEIIKDIKSENIFVLTYMDSAARNFKQRIQAHFPDLNPLPHISTIHALALKILKENNNYTFLGLDDNFEIIDENKNFEIISTILANNDLEAKYYKDYSKGISDFKGNSENKLSDIKSVTFKTILREYEKYCKENNLIDYDDLLLLCLKLLRENDEIKKYYQDQAWVLIEDEAQDSSKIQQDLISTLAGKHENIIRCGDVNQAINSTFSNADTQGFRRYIEENQNVEMNYSQRCGVKIIDFANKIVDYGQEKSQTSFLNMHMKPVEGKNSTHQNAVNIELFNDEKDEIEFVTKEIAKIQKKLPNSSIAVLLRSNFQINEFEKILSQSNIKSKKNFDTLNNNPVFKTVLAVFNIINQTCIKESVESLLELDRYKNEGGFLNHIKDNSIFDSKGDKYSIWWDLKYFYFYNTTSTLELLLKICGFYFSKSNEFSNISVVYSAVEKIHKSTKTFEKTVLKMNDLKNKINKSVVFFKNEDEEEDKTQAVQLMTVHKSKGDEFDFVFIPYMSSKNYGLNSKDIEIKGTTEFLRKIKSKPKDIDSIKQEILDENYRLVYVAITRAKHKLYLSCSSKYKYFKKEVETTPCEILKLKEGANADF